MSQGRAVVGRAAILRATRPQISPMATNKSSLALPPPSVAQSKFTGSPRRALMRSDNHLWPWVTFVAENPNWDHGAATLCEAIPFALICAICGPTNSNPPKIETHLTHSP